MAATAHLNFSEADVGQVVHRHLVSQRGGHGRDHPHSGEDTETVSAFVPNYTHDLDLDATVEFVLTYTNHDGDDFSQKASAPIQLETFEDLGLADAEITVSCPRFWPPGRR